MIHSNIYISSLATKRFVRALVTTCPILTLNFCWMPSLIIYMLIHSGVVFTQIQVELLDCDTSRFLVRFQIVTCDWPYIGFVRSVDSNRVIRRTCLKKKNQIRWWEPYVNANFISIWSLCPVAEVIEYRHYRLGRRYCEPLMRRLKDLWLRRPSRKRLIWG